MRRRAADGFALAVVASSVCVFASCGNCGGSGDGPHAKVDAGATAIPSLRADGSPRPARDRPVPVSFVELARRLDPSVVTVTVDGAGVGSGVVIDANKRLVVTNDHVIRGASRVSVMLAGGSEAQARVIGRDRATDIGLLQLERVEGLAPAELGDSDALEVGEWVVAIGNPFGLDHTVTAGIVSAKGRSAREVPGPDANAYQSFIQTDASINPGNSGGPLLDVDGRVVGINTAVDARGAGIGYAIPINMVKQILPMLERDGVVKRAYLGVLIAPVDREAAAQLGLDRPRGALVADVGRDTPAARAGLQPGDVILAVDGAEVDDRSLPWVASVAGVGKTLSVEVWRSRKAILISMKTEIMP
jgi:serine protease Do